MSDEEVQSPEDELRDFIESHTPKHTMVAGMQWDFWTDAMNALDELVAQLEEAKEGWVHMSNRYMDVHIESQKKDAKIAKLEEQLHRSRSNGFIRKEES